MMMWTMGLLTPARYFSSGEYRQPDMRKVPTSQTIARWYLWWGMKNQRPSGVGKSKSASDSAGGLARTHNVRRSSFVFVHRSSVVYRVLCALLLLLYRLCANGLNPVLQSFRGNTSCIQIPPTNIMISFAPSPPHQKCVYVSIVKKKCVTKHFCMRERERERVCIILRVIYNTRTSIW